MLHRLVCHIGMVVLAVVIRVVIGQIVIVVILLGPSNGLGDIVLA